MSLIKYKPINTFGPLYGGFDDLFNIFDMIPRTTRTSSLARTPRSRVRDLEEEYVIELATPGVAKEDLVIDVDDGYLTVSYEVKEDSTFQESFKRSWSIPDNVDIEAVKAEYTNGILSVSVPKTQPATPPTRRIAIA